MFAYDVVETSIQITRVDVYALLVGSTSGSTEMEICSIVCLQGGSNFPLLLNTLQQLTDLYACVAVTLYPTEMSYQRGIMELRSFVAAQKNAEELHVPFVTTEIKV